MQRHKPHESVTADAMFNLGNALLLTRPQAHFSAPFATQYPAAQGKQCTSWISIVIFQKYIKMKKSCQHYYYSY